MPSRSLVLAFLALSAMPAAAQSPARTGTGGGIGTAVTAPNTTATGQTKPPGAAAAPERGRDGAGRTAHEKKGDAIDSGICIGCNK